MLRDMGKFKFICAICNSGNMQFELIEPVYGDTIYDRFLQEHGEGLHHFKEKIQFEDWPAVVQRYQKEGIHISMCGAYGNTGWAYLDTEKACIMELGDMLPNESFPEGSEVSYLPPKDGV